MLSAELEDGSVLEKNVENRFLALYERRMTYPVFGRRNSAVTGN